MKIPKFLLEGFWREAVRDAAVLFKSLPDSEPLLKRKIIETVYARFAYCTVVDVLTEASSPGDITQWEQDIQQQLEIFKALLLGLFDESFATAFKILESDNNIAIIALARKDDYYQQLLNNYPDPFLGPVIELLVEVDRRWFSYLWSKNNAHIPPASSALRADRITRVAKLVLDECQVVVTRSKMPE